MRAADLATRLLALGLVAGPTGCVLDARLGALDGDGDGDVGSGGDDTEAAGTVGDGTAPEIPPGLEPIDATAVILDCAEDDVSGWRAIEASEPRLWVGGVYQTRSDHSSGNHPVGAGTVTWGMPGRNVLVLSAYEPTTWTVTLAPGGALEQVIATGYHVQTVVAPEGVDVATHAYESGAATWACGYSLPGQGGGCEGEELVAWATAATGLPLHAFDGCYDATTFEYLP